ncbi:MAG: MoaD/ThiS family protein [Chloroflexota bacterium]|nr:MAG: molybdopterin synthase sulfur carrier subunit [Chloroflexota bacterium]
MSRVRIPPVLRKQTGGSRDVEADGGTVGEVLRSLVDQFPALDDQLYENQELRRFVNVYVNDQDIQYLNKLDTAVGPQDTVIILPAMAGGNP